MSKILIELFVPSTNSSYDMFIPQDVQMCEILVLIKKAISELSDGRFVADDNTLLCTREDGTILNINLSAYELEIQNSSKLMLI